MNDDFWGPLSSEKNAAPKSAQQMAEADRNDQLADKAAENKQVRNRRLLGGAGVLAFVLMVGAAIAINPFANELTDKTVKKEIAVQATKANEPEPGWYEKKENLVPDEGQGFEEIGKGQSVTADNLPDGVKEAVDEVWGGSQASAEVRATLPGEAQGYTSDTDKIYNKDGSLNSAFSFWTGELFLEQSTVQVARLLNPAYGGWGKYQFAESNPAKNFDPKVLNGVFSPEYVKRIQKMKDKRSVPIYADWNRNGYNLGNQLLSSGQSGYRWIGEVTGQPDANLAYDSKTYNYRVTVTYPVQFTAFTVDQNKIIRKGTLKVVFAANVGAGTDGSAFRVVVDDGTLDVK